MNYGEYNPPDIEKFKKLKEDEYFINNTDKDLLLIYPDGSMTLGMSKIKFHENYTKVNEDGEIVIEINEEIIPSMVKEYVKESNVQIQKEINELTYGNPQLVEKYYYGFKGENVGKYHELPTLGHPVIIKSKITFLLVLYDDERAMERAIKDITESGGPKKYIDSFINDEFYNIGMGVKYINFSPFDIYYASYDNRRVSMIRHMTKEESIRYINKSNDWITIDNFRAEIEEGRHIIIGIVENNKMTLHKFEREENCTLVTNSLQFAESGRCDEIIPLFYRRLDAQFYLDNYDANPTNVYLDAASAVSERRTEEAVGAEVQISKKNMTSVAKICVAMVTSGLTYGIGRTLIEKIIEGKKKKESVDAIIRSVNIGNAIGKSALKSGIDLGIKPLKLVSKFSSPYAMGLKSVAVVCGISLNAILTVAGLIVIGVTIANVIKYKEKIKDFIDEHPVLDKVVTGIKNAAIGALAIGVGVVVAAVGAVVWTAKKIWSGIKKIGSWFGDLFGI